MRREPTISIKVQCSPHGRVDFQGHSICSECHVFIVKLDARDVPPAQCPRCDARFSPVPGQRNGGGYSMRPICPICAESRMLETSRLN